MLYVRKTAGVAFDVCAAYQMLMRVLQEPDPVVLIGPP
ncbi:hypothetical protein N234_30400 [Ralstonia pickettii DTP0602]|nr:hypothetical protein N234_30400 [Ralstonia pickettii DTP0602]